MNAGGLRGRAEEAAAWIGERLEGRPLPTLALIAGSGLGGLADRVRDAHSFSTTDIPHWPQSTVDGHAGRLVIGTLAGVPIMVLKGRVHLYEGYPAALATFPIRVLQVAGLRHLIVTNAAGGLHPTWSAGDIMLIRDHINLPGIAGLNPLIGPNDATLGPRFPDMSHPYSLRLQTLAREAAAQAGLTLREGVYLMVSGPTYETPAELRMMRMLGGDAVGMSTAPEVVVARHGGIEVVGLSLLTNMALLDPSPDDVTSHDEVLETGAAAGPAMERLIEHLVRRIGTL